MVGIRGDLSILNMDGFTPFGVNVCRVYYVCSGVRSTGVECRVSVRAGALRSGQLGSSEWCTLWWIIRHFIYYLLLTVSWWLHARYNLVSQVNPVDEFNNYTTEKERFNAHWCDASKVLVLGRSRYLVRVCQRWKPGGT